MSLRETFAAAAIATCGIAAFAQAPSTRAPVVSAVTYRAGQYAGVGTCANSKCHGKVSPGGGTNVRQDEFSVWQHSDRHTFAVRVLGNPVSQRIAANLKLTASPSESPRCLVCHAVTAERGGTGAIVDKDSGISCEGCHGPAGGWIDGHQFPASWKHAQSVAAGMNDLRRIEVRTAACERCHLGTTDGQVDHDLVAAGHPELFFELASFSDFTTSVHWWFYEELPDRSERTDTHFVRAFLVGQVESLRLSLSLLAGRARAGAWPEYTELTCDDCHHALADGGWRQKRGYLGRPGVAAWSPAHWIVARHVIEALAPDRHAALSAEMAAVAEAASDPRRPASELLPRAEQAASLAAEIEPLVAGFTAQRKLPSDKLEAILRAIVADPEFRRTGDRQSARQIAAAATCLTDGISYGRPRTPSVGKWLNALYAAASPVTDQGAQKSYDREAFLSALSAIPAVLR